jgi:uncharacterized protein (DUF2141 family)
MKGRLWPVAALLLTSVTTAAHQKRDVRTAPAGTAEISGVVWSSETPRQPVRRVVVSISGTTLPDVRSVITDDSGRFSIGRLPAGTFSVTARKATWLDAKYGAEKPGRPGSPLVLTAGQHRTIDITLFKSGVIAGTLRTPAGEPLAGVTVAAADVRGPWQSALFDSKVFTTDDRGAYRIYGLMPGEYVVLAAPRYSGIDQLETMSVGDMEAILGDLGRRQNQAATAGAMARGVMLSSASTPVAFAPIYFPGTAHYSDAARIRVAAGEERDGVSFEVNYVRVATIEGTIAGEIPKLDSAQLGVVLPGPRVPALSGTLGIIVKPPNDRGEFWIGNVPPGHYRIIARGRRGPADPSGTSTPPAQQGGGGGAPGTSGAARPSPSPRYTGDQLFAVADIDVRGQDVKGVLLSLQPGGTLGGKLVFDGSTAIPTNLGVIRVGLSQTTTSGAASSAGTVFGTALTNLEHVNPGPDGTFRIMGIGPAAYTLNVVLPIELRQTWRLRSAMVDGRDLLDESIEGPAVRLEGVTVTLTDRRTGLSGTLQSASGQPVAEYFIVVFSQDRRHWRAGARRSQSTRPDTNGRFLFADLPPGEYLLAALTDLDPSELQDPAFLDQAVQAAIKVSVVEGRTTVQDVRIR